MVDITRPEYGKVWASEGEKLSPTQDKLELGWVQEMMPFQWENFLQARQDEAITYLLQKGIPEYSATQEYIAQKSVVLYQGAVYLATQTVTNVLPSVAASWKRVSTISDASGVVSVTGGGTGATTATQARTNLGLGTASTLNADVVVQKDENGNFSAGVITASLSGNASSADKWKTPRTINITGAATSDTKNIDGTSNTTLTISELDATKLVGTTSVNTTGSAATATKWTNARVVSLTGGASGTSNASDGSSNFEVNVTSLNASSLSSGTVPSSVLTNAVTKTSPTGSALLPAGSTEQRDVPAQEAYFRYNKTTKLPEFHDNIGWKSVTGLNSGNFVEKTSSTGAAYLPAGSTTERPSSVPSTAFAMRLNKTTGKPEWYNHERSEWQDIGGTGILFEPFEHNGPVETIPEGFIPASGQKWYAATYPDAATAIEAGRQFVKTEAEWQAGVAGNIDAYKGCWSLGGTDANGRWYRAPKLNRDGTYRAPFLRGSEIGVDAGVMTDDRMRNIEGTAVLLEQSYPAGLPSTGALSTRPKGTSIQSGGYSASWTEKTEIVFDASLVVPTGPENSPRYHGVIMCIRMFGTVSNPGSVDAAQLATDLGVANAKIAALETELEDSVSFTIIYPNGGTEISPANIAIKSRYVLANPFPGSQVICQAEINVGGEWGDSGLESLYFTKAHQHGDSIVVQTGRNGLAGYSDAGGNPFNISSVVTVATCRVKVWKVKGSLA